MLSGLLLNSCLAVSSLIHGAGVTDWMRSTMLCSVIRASLRMRTALELDSFSDFTIWLRPASLLMMKGKTLLRSARTQLAHLISMLTLKILTRLQKRWASRKRRLSPVSRLYLCGATLTFTISLRYQRLLTKLASLPKLLLARLSM